MFLFDQLQMSLANGIYTESKLSEPFDCFAPDLEPGDVDQKLKGTD